jgi:hypothetical protein
MTKQSICKLCGKTFIGTNPNQQYCSNVCSYKAKRTRDNKAKKEYRRKNVKKIKKFQHKYYKKRKQYFSEQMKHYRLTHKDYLKSYRKLNLEHIAYISAKRRMINRGLPIELTEKEFSIIMHSKCSYCGEQRTTGTVDRINSSLGYTKANTQPLCIECNRIKSNYIEKDFFNKIKQITDYRSKLNNTTNPTRKAICSVHREIDDLLDDLGNLSLVFNDRKALVAILEQMRALVAEAMESGQKMEDRLTAYRLMIEDLGFIRDKDHKIKDEIANLKERIFELENLPNES